MRDWRRHLVYRKACVKTTWKFRIAALVVVLTTVVTTRGLWAGQIGRSLVCVEDAARSDLLLLENFDPSYLVFEHAAKLQKAGLAPRALVPVEVSSVSGVPSRVSRGVAEVMAGVARLGTWDVFPFSQVEPISLNAAVQLREHLTKERVTSVIVVAPSLRSRRSALVYRTELGASGIRVSCAPVFGPETPEHWTATWHGIQQVTLEFLKLQYYRFYVLPFLARNGAGRPA